MTGVSVSRARIGWRAKIVTGDKIEMNTDRLWRPTRSWALSAAAKRISR